MHKFSVSFILLFIGWILFTGATYPAELIIGIAISIIIADICGKFMFYESPWQLFNPKSMINQIIYLFILLYSEIRSHIDLAARIITGNINPAIIKITTIQTTDFTKTLVANAITMTPGTLTLKIDSNEKDLYIHCINYTKKEDIHGLFERYAKKVIP
ncbi:MAG: Na+/H+ antiporter subunit E [archaeon]